MSLYNTLFGVNDAGGLLLNILQLDDDTVPRLRDCYFDTEKQLICVHTRTGGGNRDFYENQETCERNYPEYFECDYIPCGPWNDDLRAHELYQYDEDSSADATYANFYFKVPQEITEELNKLPVSSTPEQKWEILFKHLRG
jgi:hypothetical protein